MKNREELVLSKIEKGGQILIRIKDTKLANRLNKYYEDNILFYESKNSFFNHILNIGIEFAERDFKDNWDFLNNKRTVLEAINFQTKRVNFLIKFSAKFIKTCFANSEVNNDLNLKILEKLILDPTEGDLVLKELNKQEYKEITAKYLEKKAELIETYEKYVE